MKNLAYLLVFTSLLACSEEENISRDEIVFLNQYFKSEGTTVDGSMRYDVLRFKSDNMFDHFIVDHSGELIQGTIISKWSYKMNYPDIYEMNGGWSGTTVKSENGLLYFLLDEVRYTQTFDVSIE